MGRSESLGEFEQLVVLAIAQLGDEAYTVPVIDEIEARTGRQVSHASVYVALRRLEKKGLVASRMSAPTRERGGRSRRYFRVEPEALRLVREQRDALLAMWEGLEPRAP